MGAMENALASMLQKAIPPEILAALAPEKLEEYKNGVRAAWLAHKEQLDRIEATQVIILEELRNGRTGNDNSNSRGSRKRGNGNDS